MEIALENLSRRRWNARRELEEKKREVYKHLPELEELDKQMSKISLAAIKQVAIGENSKAIEELKLASQNLQMQRAQLLAKNEIHADFFKLNCDCSTCKDEGYVAGAMCGCLKKLLIEDMAKGLNSKIDLDKFSFSNFKLEYFSNELIAGSKTPITQREQARQNYEYCLNFAKTFVSGVGNILMQGLTGLGKTHLALAIAKWCLGCGYTVVYVLAGQMINELEEERFSRGEQKISALNSFLDCDLIIIDDLGSEPQTQFANSSIFSIIDLRLLARKSTIINTDLSGAEVIERYGGRVSSRLNGEYKVLRFFGNDIRLQKK
jgi:DNA replication protein DnaC